MSGSLLPRVADVEMAPTARPVLLVIVDTEEEFDWNAPFSRASTTVSAMKHVTRAHGIFARYRIRPTYVMDYPVAAQIEGVRPLQELFGSGACAIGAHLHPWVNPPYSDDVSSSASFTCNLSPELQASKLRALSDTIAERFNQVPRVFKAGRYGIGRSTVEILDQMGFHVDVSVSPRMDFSQVGGPCFTEFDSRPFFLTPTLLECPCTIDYAGWIGTFGPALHRFANGAVLERMHAPGILAKLRVVNRIMLSPEGNTLAEMCTLARDLYRRGLRVFTLSYHSPSLEPGHTPYVRTERDLERFLSCLDGFCGFFMSELQGSTTTPEELRDQIMSEATT